MAGFVLVGIFCHHLVEIHGLSQVTQMAMNWHGDVTWNNQTQDGLSSDDHTQLLAHASDADAVDQSMPYALQQRINMPPIDIKIENQKNERNESVVKVMATLSEQNVHSKKQPLHAASARPFAIQAPMINEFIAQRQQRGSQQSNKHSKALDQWLSVPILSFFCLFLLASLGDVQRLVKLARTEPVAEGMEKPCADKTKSASKPSEQDIAEWTVWSLIGLTSYRFYTGFLSATWMPYLLAREGEDIWKDKQSLFMGYAKLIFGFTILLNPIFGRLGDKAASLSHGVGRRLFMRFGVSLASIGIFVAIVASRSNHFGTFMIGITLWRFGEALNDVTSEALVPELLPQHQWKVGSSVKSVMFFIGGLLGYILLLCMPGVHYSWLYYAYLVGMLTLVVPPIMLLTKESPSCAAAQKNTLTFFEQVAEAYIAPATCQGGFPLACLAIFLFSLGTAPIFFNLLIVRDIVGMYEPQNQQRVFSIGSILFLCFCALSAVLAGHMDKKEGGQQQRPQRLIKSMVVFGIMVMVIPFIAFVNSTDARIYLFYSLTCCIPGLAFGSAFTRFQDCTWEMIPFDANLANALGFNVMSKLFGVGVGNFTSGLLLDWYTIPGEARYEVNGYIVMCFFSATCVFISCYVCNLAVSAGTKDVAG